MSLRRRPADRAAGHPTDSAADRAFGRRPARAAAFRRAVAASTVAVAMAAPVAVPPLAGAQDDAVGTLIAELEELGREAERNSEDVNRLDGEVADKERLVQDLEGDVGEATRAAESARDSVEIHREDIATFARQLMRGDAVDPLTAVLGSSDAQDALDRSSYVAQLTRDKENTLEQVSRNRRAAADEFARAASARATAQFELGQLEHSRSELDRRNGELEERTGELMQRVDALNPAELERWRNKDNPFRGALESLLGNSGVVDAAVGKVGSPYSWGATGPDSFDCSGLMYWAYQQMGKTIPRTSQAQLAGGTPVSRDELRPGDLIGFYEGITHVGMYVGDGMIVHASTYGIPVQVVPIEQGGPYMGAVRY